MYSGRKIIVMLIIGASPFLVMNVAILSVSVSVCHGPARYLFFVHVTLYQLLRESCAWARDFDKDGY